MSPTYISGLVAVIIGILGIFKINIVSNEELTRIIEGGAVAIIGIITAVRRYKHGGITLAGIKNNVGKSI